MLAFINERSFEQHADLGVALRLCWVAATELAGKAELFRDSRYFAGAEFKQRFGPAVSQLAPELRALVRQVAFSDRYWKCWTAERLSGDADVYHSVSPEVDAVDESLGEAAERQLGSTQVEAGMLSAADSIFGNVGSIVIAKGESTEFVELYNVVTIEGVRKWIAGQRAYFDASQNAAPRDFQTVLEKDTARFRRTVHFHAVAGKERRIYEEIQTGNLYYVDEGHPGYSAHFEVFDRTRRHLGVADINTGIVDTTKRVKGRKITL